MKPIKLLILFFIVNITIKSYATIHYVSHDGSNTPPYLTWQTAADSIQSAINVCSAGDTVLVANGIYPENLVIQNIPIYLLGSSMDSTIIDGTGLIDSTIFFDNSNSTIENFNIYGRGIGSYSYAIIFRGSPPLVVEDCRISKTGYGIVSIGNSGISANNVLFENITVECFSIYNDGNNLISDCLILLNSENSSGVHIGFAPNATATITNNIILLTDTNGTGNGRGIITGMPKRVYIYNNLISGRFPVNIDLGNNVQDTAFLKNNVLIYQATNGPASIETGSKTIVNNVIMKKNHRGIDGNGRTRSNYNIFWKNGEDLHGLTYGDSDMVKDPMFVKDTLPNPQLDFDYHLQAFSPGIDKGDPKIKDVDGTRSDIGMFGGPYGESYTYQDLAPRPPVNLSAVVDTSGIYLKWNKNTEADTAYYNVYRDTTQNFTLDSTKIIGTPRDTFFTDITPKGGRHLYYKLTAVDKQGNESEPSEEIDVFISSMTTNDIITINDYKLYQNYPNPFNPSTKIGYRLKESGYVKLMVYDILGRLVKVLVNKSQSAGYYEATFSAVEGRPETGIKGVASGIYIYRIEVIGKGNIPVFTDMKKMVLVK